MVEVSETSRRFLWLLRSWTSTGEGCHRVRGRRLIPGNEFQINKLQSSIVINLHIHWMLIFTQSFLTVDEQLDELRQNLIMVTPAHSWQTHEMIYYLMIWKLCLLAHWQVHQIPDHKHNLHRRNSKLHHRSSPQLQRNNWQMTGRSMLRSYDFRTKTFGFGYFDVSMAWQTVLSTVVSEFFCHLLSRKQINTRAIDIWTLITDQDCVSCFGHDPGCGHLHSSRRKHSRGSNATLAGNNDKCDRYKIVPVKKHEEQIKWGQQLKQGHHTGMN